MDKNFYAGKKEFTRFQEQLLRLVEFQATQKYNAIRFLHEKGHIDDLAKQQMEALVTQEQKQVLELIKNTL